MTGFSCVSCDGPLVIEVELDSDDEEHQIGSRAKQGILTIPDDVELAACRDHYHWECLLEACTGTQCPHCSKSLDTISPDGTRQIFCTLRNEGGVQEDFDIFPVLTEEIYLKTNPNERKPRAFLDFCREGDMEAILGILKETYDEEPDEEDENVDILRYQDSLRNLESALHIAVTQENEQLAWLLLLRGSNLDWFKFPPLVLRAADHYGISAENRHGEPDVRGLKNSRGITAAGVAQELGGIWSTWNEDGILSP